MNRPSALYSYSTQAIMNTGDSNRRLRGDPLPTPHGHSAHRVAPSGDAARSVHSEGSHAHEPLHPTASFTSLQAKRIERVELRDDGGVAAPCPCAVVGVRRVGTGTLGTRRQAGLVHRHVHRPLLALHDVRVAKLYAVDLPSARRRVGDGVREKSGRGGVARSRPGGRAWSEASE